MSEKYSTYIEKELNDSLVEKWKNLWERAENANIFNSYEWFLTCLRTFKVNDYEIYVCKRNDTVAGILPVISTRCYGVKTMSAIGSVYIVETPFLVEKYDLELIRSLFGEIILRRNIFITKIDKTAMDIMKKAFPNLFVTLASVNPYLEIDSDPLRYISKSNLQNIQRRMRKYEGELRLEVYDNKSDLNKSLERMFEIEQMSSKKRHDMDLFSKNENRDLYRNLVRYYSKFITICFLMQGLQAIAYSFNFNYKKICLFFQIAYLYEYRKLSPGKVMTLYLLKKLQKGNIKYFDFSGGISNYKQEFTPNYYFQYNIYYSENALVRSWWKLISFARRMNQIIFPKKNTRDHEFLFKTL